MKVSMRWKRKENLKNFYPNECTSDRRHLECFVTSLYLVATQVSYCAKGLMGCFILWHFLILTPINWQVNLVNGLNGILHVKDQWNSSWVSYKNGGFLSGYKQKIWNSSGMKINLYQNLQGWTRNHLFMKFFRAKPIFFELFLGDPYFVEVQSSVVNAI